MDCRRCSWLVTAVLSLAFVAPAAAQFNPAFNHLKCYQIKGQPIVKTLVVDNQFGRERIVKLTPVFLCTPAKKTCCAASAAGTTGCNVVPCPVDPVPPTAVPHYKCYKIAVKSCTDPAGTPIDCTKLTNFPKNLTKVNLRDQFDDETLLVGAPKMLCTPVEKTVVSPTTSTTTTVVQTTSTTTTTTIPCRDLSQPGTPAMCGGGCQNPTLACVFVPNIGCTCELPCADINGTCSLQFCPNQGQQCVSNAVIACGCCNPSGASCSAGSECCSGNCSGSICQ